ncbi:unnamed protein product [Polarella glacialis]|uniref:R3H domain-containing protein n=1 Tax=Polarella glacialis TaxID=89957 RepID=A0A813HWI4_POLGL|nr:unnamed protein product [Polarella glacialis]
MPVWSWLLLYPFWTFQFNEMIAGDEPSLLKELGPILSQANHSRDFFYLSASSSESDAASLAEEQRKLVRRAFRDTWQFLSRDTSSQELIAKLEAVAENAFAAGAVDKEELLWLLSWDGDDLTTECGAPPAEEMVLRGLDGAQRKVVHQLARLLGLHSESRILEEDHKEDVVRTTQQKVLAIRPPRSLKCRAGAWTAPFSVTQVLTSSLVSA